MLFESNVQLGSVMFITTPGLQSLYLEQCMRVVLELGKYLNAFFQELNSERHGL